MILTKHAIANAVAHNQIEIVPYSEKYLNPNSYNYRLGKTLKEHIETKPDGTPVFHEFEIPEEGHLLKAKRCTWDIRSKK